MLKEANKSFILFQHISAYIMSLGSVTKSMCLLSPLSFIYLLSILIANATWFVVSCFTTRRW